MELNLPLYVVSQVDITRMLREVKELENFFVQAKARQGGVPMQQPLPKLSHMLEKLAQENNYNLLNENERQKLAEQLNQLATKAPLLHISFATEPSSKVLQKLLGWFRSNIHPYTLLQVGLQPALAVGCVLRTPNKVFDMSMRANLVNQQQMLVRLIDEANKAGDS